MGRIFIDVTQSCRSSNNSGIQVVTRNLFREVSSKHKTVPMIWDDRLRKYARLSQQELKNLENPFQEGYLPKSRPNKQENPFYKEILQTIFRIGRTIRLNQAFIEKNLFFIPEVFRDRRVNQLPKILHKNLKRTAIFHDANVLRDPQNTPSARVQNFEKYLSVISSFDRISCVSVESMDIFKETLNKRKSTQKIKVHRLPVEKNKFTQNLNDTKEPLILCVSTLAYNKNHLNLLRALENLWQEGLNFNVNFVGQADSSWTPKVVESINVLQNKNRPLQWLMHIDQNTLEEIYSSCSFTVYPSLYEGFGLPILESLIRGKPCICGKNGALGEVSTAGGCLTVSNQNDPNQLADAIRKLLTDSSILERLKIEASQRNFGSWKEYSIDLLDFFFADN